jgi:hypothetical protein
MKSLVVMAVVVMASPAGAQNVPRTVGPKAGRADPCAPIGRTADGKLVYSLKCDNLPAPPVAAATPPAASVAEPDERGGLFRNPFPSLMGSTGSVERESGVGPSTGGR